MMTLGHVILLLLLSSISCQNNRNPKQGGRPVKKASTTGAEVTLDDYTNQGPGSALSSSKESRGGNQQGASANKPTNDMKLHLLRNTPATCNDGTMAGFYLKEFKGSRRWLIFLEGGWCCYNKESCDSRYKNIPRLMSSSDWPQTRKGTGILSSHADENPHWYNTNIVFVPYCSSDVWSGNKPAAKNKPAKETEFSFMGSVIIRELIKDLALKGLKQAKLVMLAGASAGGTGVLLNMEKVANQLEQLGVEAQVRGLVDSGWFLESKQQKLSSDCPEGISCSPVDAIKRGIRLWNGVIPEKCKQNYKRGEEWQCFFGHKLYSFLNLPLFVVQWLFDEEQLRMEDIYMGGQTLSEQQWNYMQNLGKELKNSLRDVTAVFAPSCLSHTMITKRNWVDFQVKGTSLSRALQCWDRSLQEVNRNSKVPLKGCPFHLIDTCHWPQCNPTCPALIDQATQQEMTLLQVLTKMGLDLQKLSSETHRDNGISGVVSNGG